MDLETGSLHLHGRAATGHFNDLLFDARGDSLINSAKSQLFINFTHLTYDYLALVVFLNLVFFLIDLSRFLVRLFILSFPDRLGKSRYNFVKSVNLLACGYLDFLRMFDHIVKPLHLAEVSSACASALLPLILLVFDLSASR